MLEGITESGHQDADIASAGPTDMEPGQVEVCFWVDDAVPGLVGGDPARAGAGSRWRSAHLVEHFKAVVFLFYHLGPG